MCIQDFLDALDNPQNHPASVDDPETTAPRAPYSYLKEVFFLD